ncbi:MAG: TauD/TfdA family dioxygenase, partial [Sphingomonadaceae bacterium]|nr:TauD/TfdA family dioxygenase [Sphingomonadaceae bacterium]
MASLATAYKVSPLAEGAPFGARVSGLTLKHLEDEAIRKQLFDLWIDKGVILFRDGESSPEMQIELSSCFGTPEKHPLPESRLEGNETLTRIKYYPEDGSIFDVNGEMRGGYLPWHSDLVYNPAINHGGILRPVILPKKYGETGYLCQIAAYDRLPQRLREKIEGLHAVYELRIKMCSFDFIGVENMTMTQMSKSGESIDRRRFQLPRVIHPMVYTQEGTGRKVLNVSPTFALGIYEDGTLEGDALFQEICDYCMDPDLAYFHKWEMDDMVLWDNWRVLH